MMNYINTLFGVEGKVALVTGGRRGLGLGMAEALGKAGAKVAIASQSTEFEELSANTNFSRTEVTYFQTDLGNRKDRSQLVARVVERFDGLDILVNSAGIQHREAAVDFDADKWDQILEIMLTGVFDLCRQAARVMEPRGGGKIVNIASVGSFQGGLTIPAYVSAKHGLLGLTKALANEWAKKGINVNAIAPGYFDTDMCAGIKNDPVREPKIRERIPAGRWGKPEELAGALLFLSSNASDYVHGETILVDGGWMGR